MNPPALELVDIVKYYKDQLLLDGVSFTVDADETVCLLGPSGSGKSTLLRIIAGLEESEDGQVIWQGRDITSLPPHLRNFSLMFQDYALFPHLTVSENIAFGLRMRGRSDDEIRRVVDQSLSMVRMEKFGQRRVTDLSGGEQQRVALARALAPQPDMLMLDEPLGALDRTLREHLMAELRALLREIRLPVIYVTHDQQEAFTIADRLVVLHDAHILQVGKPSEVYNHPITPWLARFFGFDNHLEGWVKNASPLIIQTPVGDLMLNSEGQFFSEREKLVVVVKPDALQLDKNESMGINEISGEVRDCIFSGGHYRLVIAINADIQFEFEFDRELSKGTQLRFSLSPDSMLCYRVPT